MSVVMEGVFSKQWTMCLLLSGAGSRVRDSSLGHLYNNLAGGKSSVLTPRSFEYLNFRSAGASNDW